MTPSTFTIGTILNTYFFRNSCASSDSKYSIIPSKTNDPTVSPGCYLAINTTPVLISLEGYVIVIISKLFPKYVLHNILALK